MIYIAAFILTLFLTHIVRAVPLTCGELDDPHGLSCGDGTAQYTISNSTPLQPLLYKVTYDPTYDNPDGSMKSVACSNWKNGLTLQFPVFQDLPIFPYIRGAFNIIWNSTNCGECWILTNPANDPSIVITAIDHTEAGFNVAEVVFKGLGGIVPLSIYLPELQSNSSNAKHHMRAQTWALVARA